MLSRQDVLKKLEQFLNREITKADVHAWALSQAVAKDFEEIAESDPLIKNTVLSLIDISHDDLKRIPSIRALEYYRLCLSGEMTFDPVHANLENIIVPYVSVKHSSGHPSKVSVRIKEKAQYLVLLKAYVFIFGLCVMALQIISLLDPQFLHWAKDAPVLDGNWQDAWPHVLYAALILMPRHWLAAGYIFYPAALALATGMLYYWYVPVLIVAKLSLHILFVLALLPFSAIPATLALLLLMLYRDGLKARDARAA